MGRTWVIAAGAGRIAGTSARGIAAAALVAVVLAGCGTSSGSDGEGRPAPDYRTALTGAPTPLAALYDQAGELLPGGASAFERRLVRLRGHPVVVNKWASWCGPCRREFPFFQRLSARLGKRVAFVGVDSNDSNAAAKTFLGEFPVPYPSYSDPDQGIARLLEATVGFPATAFYDSSGKRVFVKQGQYASEAALAADIKRYAR
jgi:cytochrome c biogenesis protein CcmG, thiol:disulfide interchange protein DsbE